MPVDLRYRGRVVTAEDIVFIRQFIADNPSWSRRKLSAQLCAAWQWKQANGALCDMVCRGLLLMLHRAGEIELPATRQTSLNPFVQRNKPQPVPIDTSALNGGLTDIRPITLQQVRRKSDEPLFTSLIEHHHYLGYEQPVGEHLKYLVWAQGRPIACMAWSSAPRHLGSRDRYIGWSAEARRRNIRFVAYNTRFLILPWVRVPHLASHILGRIASSWGLLQGAAQGSVMHNDDTSMRILQLARIADDGRTGTFTGGIVSICGGWKIALYFSGWKHAGENLADVLKHRAPGLAPPIQMC